MRVAFFGGTFDPIHRGHLRLASATADAFALDRVLFVPVGNQPLKPGPTVASYADRLQMARLACNPEPPQPATGNSARSTLRRLHPGRSALRRQSELHRRLAGRACPRAARRIPLRPHRGRQLPRPRPLALSRPPARARRVDRGQPARLPAQRIPACPARPYPCPAHSRPSARHSPRGGLRHRPSPSPASRRPLPRPAPARRCRLHPEPRPLPLNPSML